MSIARRRFSSAPVYTVKLGGVLVDADLRTPQGLEIYRHGVHQPELTALQALLRPGDTMLDGGANIGLFALYGAVIVGPEGCVMACEPAPGTLRLLEGNIARNPRLKIMCYQVALSDHEGVADFTIFEDGSGVASLTPARAGTVIRVPVTRIDTLISAATDVALVKLDIEGAEVRALRGATTLLARSAPMILLEIDPGHLARQATSVADLRDLLVPHGYEAYTFSRGGRLEAMGDCWHPPDPSKPNVLLATAVRGDRVIPLLGP